MCHPVRSEHLIIWCGNQFEPPELLHILRHWNAWQAATLTWICAANVDKAVRQWTSDLRKGPKDASVEELQVHFHIQFRFSI